ncbi:MAG TPA: hypothetical protein VEC12_02065 [Bacteroidia bacterium]|nr:hypothetical protein [Bacteroidia bacterium]
MLKVIGVYKVPENSDASIVEIIVKQPYSEFDLGDITQANENLPRSSWQAPFNEKYLDNEGEKVIGDYYVKPQTNSGITRLLFFIYFLDTNKPLITPYGEFSLPGETIIPERLIGKLPFEDPE